MKIVKTFLHIYSNSLIPKSLYYHKILKTKLNFSLKYLFFLIFILNLCTLAFFAVKINPFKLSRMFSSVSVSLDRYPKDLIIRIQDGSLNTNYNRPYFLWLDDQDKKHLLAVIDIMATEDKINEYSSYLLVTKNEAIFKNALEDNKLSRIDLSIIKNEIISKQTIENVKESLLRIKSMLIILYPLALFILLVFFVMVSLVSTIIYIILASALIYVLCIFNILKLKVNFVKIFQISLHSVTLPLSINYALGALRSPTSLLPLMFLFFVTAFTLMGVNKAYTFKEHYTTSPHHKKK